MKKILIVGANSAIAEATARILAERGEAFYLVGRHPDRLKALSDDLKARGSSLVYTETMDANDIGAHAALIDRAEDALQNMDTVLIAHGTLSDQAACQVSADLTLAEIKTNALSAISLLTPIANLFEARRNGTIIVISSVAGDRGRQSNYVYGCAKAMLTAFLSGLRQRLKKSGVRVVTVKPGFVDTPMTKNFKKGFLWASPQKVAQSIVKSMDRGSGEVYAPSFWRLLMFLIRSIPESLFARLRL